jgi:hypothetical protein
MKQELIIDPEKFKEVLKKRGFKSISHLSKSCGVHRNTITEYLALRNSPFQTTFLKIAEALRTNPLDLFSNNTHYENAKILSHIGEPLEEYLSQNTSLCVVLMESNEDVTNNKINLKLGFTSGETRLGNAEFSIYKLKLEEFVRRRRVNVECFNLDAASSAFLISVPEDSRPLIGNSESYRYTSGFIRGLKSAACEKRKEPEVETRQF